ncbi:MAG: glycoside hydrolase, partial [Ruminococcus flavefaciens]|nr:glycoside hydrolase [Ruminococcus flavefaciens]
PKLLDMWNLDANQFEVTYHRYYENGYDNLFADNAEDARRILTEAAVFTVDAEPHSYIVIGRDYDPSHTEVSSVVSRYDIANYATEKLDEFAMDGVTYHVVRVSYTHTWHQETCTHDMEVTARVEAGCEVTGMETRTCRKCGYSETTYFHAYGHEDRNHDGMCDACSAPMAMNIGDEITVTWEPGALDMDPIDLNFICIDTDYQGSGKKLLYAIDALPPEYYGCYSRDGHADYTSSDLKGYLEDEFLDGLSNRTVLASVGDRSVGLLTPDEYKWYKAQAVNVYKFPSGLTVLHEAEGADGLVALSNNKRVTPEEAGKQPVHPVIFMDAGGAVEGTESGRWEVGDFQSRHIGDKSYLFRCINDNYKDNSNLDKTLAVFVCDTVIPSCEGLGFNEDNTKQDTRFFGDSNNYRYSVVRQFLRENQRETGSLVTMDVGVKNEYEGSTAYGAFEALDDRDLIRHKRNVSQYLEEKLYIPSVEEALDMRDYLWKFDRSDRDNIDAVYDGNYLTHYWLRTPVYGTDDLVYTVNLKDGTIEPHSVKEEYGIPGTHAYMEYSADNGNTWSPCTEGTTTVPGPGAYLVREKAGGQAVEPVLSGGMYVLQGTASGQEYSTDGGATWKPCSDGQTATGVGSTCLVRVKGNSYQVSANTAVQVLTATDASMEWSADGGATWNACGQTLTPVPAAGTYAMRRKDNPDGLWEQASQTRYRIDGTAYGQEYSMDGGHTWQICTDGSTYVLEPGQYTIRRTETGEDREAVKKTCSVGIRPMYAVYQER